LKSFAFIFAIGVAVLWSSAFQFGANQVSANVDPFLLNEQLAEIESLEALQARLILIEASDKEQYAQIDELEAKYEKLEARVTELSKVKTAPTVVATVDPPKVVPAPVVKVETPRGSVAVGPAIAKPTPVASQQGPVVSVRTPKVSVAVAPQSSSLLGTYSQPDGYTSRMTYPGDIAVHLPMEHGISTAGMTKEDAERAHDAAHLRSPNVSVSSRSVIVNTPMVQRSVVRSTVRSDCPNGNCPNPRVQVRRPFLWRR
jgi:hypothetical protein